MDDYKKIIICIALLIMPTYFMAGCGSKPPQKKVIDSRIVSGNEINSISENGKVIIADDSCAAVFWVPKNQKITLNKITSWLQKSKLYTGKIPKSNFSGIFNANIGPSKLNISTSDNHNILIQPEWYLFSKDGTTFQTRYIKDVLEVNNDGKKFYIQSSQLYDWLKNDKWKAESNYYQ